MAPNVGSNRLFRAACRAEGCVKRVRLAAGKGRGGVEGRDKGCDEGKCACSAGAVGSFSINHPRGRRPEQALT